MFSDNKNANNALTLIINQLETYKPKKIGFKNKKRIKQKNFLINALHSNNSAVIKGALLVIKHEIEHEVNVRPSRLLNIVNNMLNTDTRLNLLKNDNIKKEVEGYLKKNRPSTSIKENFYASFLKRINLLTKKKKWLKKQDSFDSLIKTINENDKNKFMELIKNKDIKKLFNKNSNELLILAIRKNCNEVAIALLKIDEARKQVHKKHNVALITAIQYGLTDVVKELLTIDKVKKNANQDLNNPLLIATEKKHLNIVIELLKIDKVKNDQNNKYILERAIEEGHIDIAIELLKIDTLRNSYNNYDDAFQNSMGNYFSRLQLIARTIPQAAAQASVHTLVQNNINDLLKKAIQAELTDVVIKVLNTNQLKNNLPNMYGYALSIAAETGNTNILTELLKLDQLKIHANYNNNLALQNAITKKNDKIVEELLKVESVKENISFDLLQKCNYDTKLIPYVKIGNIPLKSILNEDLYKAFIANPEKVFPKIVSEKNISEYYNSLKSTDKQISKEALTLLKIQLANQKIKNTELKWQNNSETAMSPIVIGPAQTAYQKAEELYGRALNEKTLEEVEKDIRDMLLEAILSELSKFSEKKKSIDPKEVEEAKKAEYFIKTNRAALIAGNDKEIMDKARQFFNSNSDNLHIAWRAYDPFASVKGKWDNLLTKPNQSNKPIFAAGAADSNQISLEKASNDARRRVALYYLALNDKNRNFTMGFEDRKAIFIGQIAEIRRAHNNLSARDKSIDDPSCYPGTVGRIATMGAGHPDLDIPDTQTLIAECMKTLLREAIKKRVASIPNDQNHDVEVEKLCLALTAFTDGTPSENLTLDNSSIPLTLEELSKLYEDVLGEIAKNEDELFEKLNTILAGFGKNKKSFVEQEKIYCVRQWLNLNHKGVAAQVAREFSKQPASDEKKEEVFSVLYPLFKEALKDQGIPENTIKYLVKKLIDQSDLLESTQIESLKLNEESLKEVYNGYLKTGFSKPVEKLNDQNINTFCQTLNDKKPWKSTEQKSETWNALEELEKSRDRFKKIKDKDMEPYKVPSHIAKNPKIEETYKKQNKINEKNSLFKNIFTIYKTMIKDNIENKEEICQFLAKKFTDLFYGRPEGTHPETIKLLKDAYNEFKKTDGFQTISILEANNIERTAEIMSSIMIGPKNKDTHGQSTQPVIFSNSTSPGVPTNKQQNRWVTSSSKKKQQENQAPNRVNPNHSKPSST